MDDKRILTLKQMAWNHLQKKCPQQFEYIRYTTHYSYAAMDINADHYPPSAFGLMRIQGCNSFLENFLWATSILSHLLTYWFWEEKKQSLVCVYQRSDPSNIIERVIFHKNYKSSMILKYFPHIKIWPTQIPEIFWPQWAGKQIRYLLRLFLVPLDFCSPDYFPGPGISKTMINSYECAKVANEISVSAFWNISSRILSV